MMHHQLQADSWGEGNHDESVSETSGCHAVDGSEIRHPPVEGFIHPRWLALGFLNHQM